jgi:hypothetical protein
MVAIMHSITQAPERLLKIKGRPDALAKLKALHGEAEETARLANLLGRSAYVGAALPFLAIVTMGLAVEMSPAPQLVWLVFVGAVALAMLIAYRRAIKSPFERAALKTYAKDLSAILLFAGFAWGAGAFLALPAAAPASAAIVFALLPAAIVATLLRDRDALFLFLAPVTALTAAACLLKPFAGGLWTAGLVVAAAALLVGAAHLVERLTGIPSKPAMLSLP